MNQKIEINNMLVAGNIGLESNVAGHDVLHIYMEDNAGVAHHVAFATRPNYTEGIEKSFRRLAPVQLPQPVQVIDQPDPQERPAVVDAE